jgi:catechol 2,3-dioxygenase
VFSLYFLQRTADFISALGYLLSYSVVRILESECRCGTRVLVMGLQDIGHVCDELLRQSTMATPSQVTHHLKPQERADQPLDPLTRIGHVHLKSADPERIYQFYVGVLGFNVVMRIDSALFVSAGNYHHHLAFNTWESEGGAPPPPGTTGLYHVAIVYPTRRALVDALHRLIDAKWPLEGASDHGTHEALYLRDPDQNGLELYWDRPENAWPLDAHGHLIPVSQNLDLANLLADTA